MDFCQLKYFVHVARLRSFTAASQRLNVAQSALSRQIKALENDLGVPLLSRTTHSVVPTEAGLQLLEMSDFILHYITQMRDKVREAANEPAGLIVVGLLPAVAYVAPPLLRRVQLEFPKVSVRVSEGLSVFLHERLLLGHVDLAVMTAGRPMKGLVEVPAVEEELVLTGLPRLLASFPDPVPFSKIAEVPILSTEGFKRIILAFAQTAGVPIRFETEQNSLMALKMMLQQGFAISILPYTVVHEDLLEGRLATRRIIKPKLSRHLAIVKPEYRPTVGAYAVIENILLEQLRVMPVSPDAVVIAEKA